MIEASTCQRTSLYKLCNCSRSDVTYSLSCRKCLDSSAKSSPRAISETKQRPNNQDFFKRKKLERAFDGAPLQIPTLKFVTPQATRSPSPGHDLGNRMKILFNMFSIFYLWEHTHTIWYKNLWNWHVNDIWPFDLAPRSPVWP